MTHNTALQIALDHLNISFRPQEFDITLSTHRQFIKIRRPDQIQALLLISVTSHKALNPAEHQITHV